MLPAVAPGLRIRRALLFGSAARGQHDWRSDIDLIVVQETDAPFVRRGVDILNCLELTADVDLLVYTPEEWAQMPSKSSLVARAIQEGEVIYAADA